MTRWIATASLFLYLAAPASAQNPTGETATPVRPRYATLTPVFFAVNTLALSDSARSALVAVIDILKVNPAAEIVVVGHTDERGSDSYNLRLGRRRAESVVAFLRQHGAAEARIEVASAGEREPAERGHNESAWARNRRVEFRVTGNTPLRLPPPR